VGVADDEQRPTAPGQLRAQVIAVEQRDVGAERSELLTDSIGNDSHAGRARRRLDLDELAQQLEHAGTLRAASAPPVRDLVARAHSSRTERTARIGSPPSTGRRGTPIRSSISSAVRYRTCSDRMCAVSCASTVRSSSGSSTSTSDDVATTIGLPAPIAAAFG